VQVEVRRFGFVLEVPLKHFKGDVGTDRMARDDDKVIRLSTTDTGASYSPCRDFFIGELDLIIDGIRRTLVRKRFVVIIVKSCQAFAKYINSNGLLRSIEKRPEDMNKRYIIVDQSRISGNEEDEAMMLG